MPHEASTPSMFNDGADWPASLVCTEVWDEAPLVRTFLFASPDHRRLDFLPGQFVTLTLDVDGSKVARSFTIASPPTRPFRVALSIKRREDPSSMSRWMHQHLRPGMEIPVSGPRGAFSYLNFPAEKYLFLSGGSGVTPLMSMARTMNDLGGSADVVFVHSASTPVDILFEGEVQLIASQMRGFKARFICTREASHKAWTGFSGRLSPSLLRATCPDFGDRTVLACGPSGFLACLKELLAKESFPMEQYHEEFFSFRRDLAPASAPPADAISSASVVEQHGFKIEFRKSNRTITCRADQSVLAAARQGAMNLAASCEAGLCGACKSTLIDGEVDMQHAGGIRPKEIVQGKFLPCCSKPLTDLVVDL